MIRAFVAGWPIAHSISPHLHRFWLDRHQLQGSYDPVAIPPDAFADFVGDLPKSKYAGGNITIPHKQAAFELCSILDERARLVGAVNTVWSQDGEICGSNTDIHGFLANLDDRAAGWDRHRNALVLGAGGAARAVLHGLAERGFSDVILVNRSAEKAEALARGIAVAIRVANWDEVSSFAAESPLIVNTTSLGMTGQPDLDIDLSRAPQGTIVNDLVYNPLETSLLANARKAGLMPVDGLGMLMHQAVPGFARWFGITPEVDDELRSHLISIMMAARDRET